MNKPFTVREEENRYYYWPNGFDYSPIRLVKPAEGLTKHFLSICLIRETETKKLKNLHAALGHAIETVEGLESE